jgi:hypothetical protein
MVVELLRPETMDQAVDRIFREQTNEAVNEVKPSDVVTAIRDWLGADNSRITAQVIVDVARKEKDRYLKRHRPSMRGGQLAIFQPHYLIPLGKGRYAWLDYATREQTLEWLAVETAAFERTKTTHDEKVRQIRERLDNWGNRQTFGEVERAVFGWTTGDLIYDDQLEDDDDD